MRIDFELTDEQQALIKAAVHWYKHESELVFQYSAPAGAGKSTVMHCIIDQLGLRPEQVAPMAYVGSAAIVMRLNGFHNASTAHSWLYKLEVETKKDGVMGKEYTSKRFVYSPLDHNEIKLICVDEASTIPLKMRQEMETNGIKILACGDLNQLPPVADKPGFLYNGKVFRLSKIMRQASHSAIVEISNMLIKGIRPRVGNYGDVLVISKDDLTDDMIKQYKTLICGTNRTRDQFNHYVRRNIIQTTSPVPIIGEKVVCRQNDWKVGVDGINLANGLAGTVANYPSITGYEAKSFTMDFVPDLFPDIKFERLKCDFKYFISDYRTRREMKSMMSNRYSSGLEKFEFGYAITTHISQGSQYFTGIYLEEHLHRDIQRNLNYTGITRFRNSCIYVLPTKRMMIPIRKSVVSLNGQSII